MAGVPFWFEMNGDLEKALVAKAINARRAASD
jgi:hypothetical protein